MVLGASSQVIQGRKGLCRETVLKKAVLYGAFIIHASIFPQRQNISIDFSLLGLVPVFSES